MDKTWSYMIHVTPSVTGKFVIKQTDASYELWFYERFGDKERMHYAENLPEIWSFLLTTKRIKTQNASYVLDVSKLGIPTKLSEWSVES